MKKLHRLFTAAMLVLALVSAMLLAGCGGSGTSSSETPSSTPSSSDKSDVSTPSSETPSTPESETPSEPESGTPSGENLLANALAGNEELLGGDSWAAKDGAWAGPLQEVREGAESYAQQAFVEETRSDGSKGICYRFYSEATKGWHTTGNTFGISSLLEANKSYKLTVSLKLTVPNPGEKDSIEVGVTNSTENSGPVTVTAKDEWQTVTYTFKTGFIFDGAYIYVGPSGVNNSIVLGEIQAGFNLLIDSISLVEE